MPFPFYKAEGRDDVIGGRYLFMLGPKIYKCMCPLFFPRLLSIHKEIPGCCLRGQLLIAFANLLAHFVDTGHINYENID